MSSHKDLGEAASVVLDTESDRSSIVVGKQKGHALHSVSLLDRFRPCTRFVEGRTAMILEPRNPFWLQLCLAP